MIEYWPDADDAEAECDGRTGGPLGADHTGPSRSSTSKAAEVATTVTAAAAAKATEAAVAAQRH